MLVAEEGADRVQLGVHEGLRKEPASLAGGGVWGETGGASSAMVADIVDVLRGRPRPDLRRRRSGDRAGRAARLMWRNLQRNSIDTSA
jgi:hypothetical protein